MKSAALRALESQVESSLAGRVFAPFAVREQRPPATLPTGVRELDTLTGGVPRGAVTEIFGAASSGRTSLLHALLSETTARQEVCALVDASDAFDPQSAAAAGVDLKRVLWARCGNDAAGGKFQVSRPAGERASRNPQGETFRRVEQALKATDLLLQAGGFGLLVVDLADIAPSVARRIPLTSWFRFRRAVENTHTALLVIEQEPYAKTCASQVLRMERELSAISFPSSAARRALDKEPVPRPAHAQLLRGLNCRVEVIRTRAERKPAQNAQAMFHAQAAWAS